MTATAVISLKIGNELQLLLLTSAINNKWENRQEICYRLALGKLTMKNLENSNSRIAYIQKDQNYANIGFPCHTLWK